MEENREKIFTQIDSLGSPEVSPAEKARVITDVAKMLEELGVQPQLVQELRAAIPCLTPLLGLTLGKKIKPADHLAYEGRGPYHENIPVAGTTATVYTRGNGAADRCSRTLTDDGSFPGFPNSLDPFFYEDTKRFDQPRVLGTQNIPCAMLEIINASVIFAEVSKKYGWKHLSEAVEAGVTIPIGVMEFPELSDYLKKLLREKVAETTDPKAKKNSQWEANFNGFGSVGMIVPGNERCIRELDAGTTTLSAKEDRQLHDLERWRGSGRTLRTLLELGIVYARDSAHGQNIYATGLVRQADNEDLVFLGDYVGIDDQWGTFTATEQWQDLLYRQLQAQDGLTPSPLPLPEHGVTGGDVIDMQRLFWNELGAGIIHPESLGQVPRLKLVFSSAINAAFAALAVEHLDTTRWAAVAKQRRQQVDRYGATYGSDRQLDHEIKTDFHQATAAQLRYQREAPHDPRGIRSMIEYLKTGDRQHLVNNPYLKTTLDLLDHVGSMSDTLLRDKLFIQLNLVQNRELQFDTKGCHDFILQYDNRPLARVQDLLTEGNPEAGLQAVKIISEISVLWNEQANTNPRLLAYIEEYLQAPAENMQRLYAEIKNFKSLLKTEDKKIPA